MSVVACVVDPQSAPWRFHDVLRQCFNVFGSEINSFISHVGRMENESADVLARMGSGGLNLIEFS